MMTPPGSAASSSDARVLAPRAATLGEMLKEIKGEGAGACNMAGRIGAMTEAQLIIYVAFLEKLQRSLETPRRTREAMEVILAEAGRVLDGYREAREAEAEASRDVNDKGGRGLAAARQKVAADERLAVLVYARKHCTAKAQREVAEGEVRSQVEYKLSLPRRRDEAVWRRRWLWQGALAVLIFGIIQHTVVGSSGGATRTIGLVLAALSYVLCAFLCGAGYWLGPDKLPPWEATAESDLAGATARRAEDYLFKWENEQKYRANQDKASRRKKKMRAKKDKVTKDLALAVHRRNSQRRIDVAKGAEEPEFDDATAAAIRGGFQGGTEEFKESADVEAPSVSDPRAVPAPDVAPPRPWADAPHVWHAPSADAPSGASIYGDADASSDGDAEAPESFVPALLEEWEAELLDFEFETRPRTPRPFAPFARPHNAARPHKVAPAPPEALSRPSDGMPGSKPAARPAPVRHVSFSNHL
ncbi:hypothetical protein M885DRAFT_513480 [Pelagophyceae sp. CCMP2097]|nr:hypothetical protein M885DRAFT_513480 [Pelagophyceae sp. CCMP2097]|mmetsp:Transcript_8952/g.30820  ORF Transcript_8952/g.30820 Transcript_8952/m.30820 type:complete len:473 (+) Transcript_8952:121-1539(+)